MVANAFNRRHGTNIAHDTVANLIERLKNRIDADQVRCCRRCTASDEGTTAEILAALTRNPAKSVRRMSADSGISKSSISRILITNKWYPYKLHMAQRMSEDDLDRRMEFYEWVLRKLMEDPEISAKILFSDEAKFYVNEEVNRQNLRYWSNGNPHWMSLMKVEVR